MHYSSKSLHLSEMKSYHLDSRKFSAGPPLYELNYEDNQHLLYINRLLLSLQKIIVVESFGQCTDNLKKKSLY